MKRILPSTLSGPRAYFINFDPRRLKTVRKRDDWKIRVSRRLKTLLLTKRSIICAASHLRSPLVFELLRENPYLLEQGLITPALRSDLPDISECVTVRGTLGHEMRSFYSNSIQKVVSWDHEFNSAGFRDRLVYALENESSLLRLNISSVASETLRDIVDRLKDIEVLSRHSLDHIISPFDTGLRSSIRRFANLMYYCSGAHTVNCETAIGDVDYIDYAIPALLSKHTPLSEDLVFWKLFIEQVLQSLHLPPIPLESLDLLTFEEIARVRTPLLDVGFCEKYDAVLEQALAAIGNAKTPLPVSVEHIVQLRDSIEETFRLVLPPQMQNFLKSQKKRGKYKIFHSFMSLGVGMLGMIPAVGTGFGLISSARTGRELYLTVQEIGFWSDIAKVRQLALEKVISESDLEGKSLLYDVVRYLNSVLATRFLI